MNRGQDKGNEANTKKSNFEGFTPHELRRSTYPHRNKHIFTDICSCDPTHMMVNFRIPCE